MIGELDLMLSDKKVDQFACFIVYTEVNFDNNYLTTWISLLEL